jgi:hypothetical protein
MAPDQVDYSALKHYSTAFTIFKWVKRIYMIVLRVAFLVLIYHIGKTLYSTGSISYESTSSGTTKLSFNPIILVLIWLSPGMILIVTMGLALQKFTKANKGFSMGDLSWAAKGIPNSAMSHMVIPSFKGKMLRVSLQPVVGLLAVGQFGLFARHYREGGILRWRERQMDTIMWYDLPKDIPHIVINARSNEHARRSNLSKHFAADYKFQFEGAQGPNFDIYAAPQDRITALQLFTPDVIDRLYTLMPNVDIEIEGRTIWFVWRYAVLNDRVVHQLFDATSVFMPGLNTQIRNAQI